MVNYNMGRYYAWSSLKQLITTRFKSKTPVYRFHYMPTTNLRAKIVPFEQWKHNKIRQESSYNIVLLALSFICFATARFVYLALYDDYLGYYYQVNYPVVCRCIELINADLTQLMTPIVEIMPKDRYQIPQILPKLWELVSNTKQRREEADRKALQMRRIIQEYDKQHK